MCSMVGGMARQPTSDVAAEQRVEQRCRAGEGHGRHIDLTDDLEQLLGREVRRGAGAGHAVGELLGLGQREQLLQVGGLEVGVGDQDVGRGAGDDHRLEVGLGRVAGVLAQARVDRVGAGGDEQRVAVGVGLGDRARGDVAAGAAAVLDDDALAPFLLQALAEDARDRVGRPAGGEGDDEAHVLGGVGVLGGGGGGG